MAPTPPEGPLDARAWLGVVGKGVQRDFAERRSLLSFDQYLDLFARAPRAQARGAAQYLRDVLDHFGTVETPVPWGKERRFRLFDLAGEGGGPAVRVAGQEEVQAEIYRTLGHFARAGRVNKLVLLHGPNGSAKSSLVAALARGMEAYSRLPEGALYRFNWVFPDPKRVKGGGTVGFGREGASAELQSFAHLEGEVLDARLPCPLRDHPLLLVPREERRALLQARAGHLGNEGVGPGGEDALCDYVIAGELCHYCRAIFNALLASYQGDYLAVLRHVQVERFYVSTRYQEAAVTVEPQLSVDAGWRQVAVDRAAVALPAVLRAVALYEPAGPLVAANRGLLELSDLLQRPPEAFKYLLGTSETARVPLDGFLLHLDAVLIASANEKQLALFRDRDLADFSSLKGRLELIRVPYLRRARQEREIYDDQLTAAAAGKHVAPHATEVAATWAVLTRLRKPVPERYQGELRELLDELSPLEKLRLYDTGAAPDRFSLAQARELRKHAEEVWREHEAEPVYEGSTGASARELKTVLLDAAQSPRHPCLTPMAVLEELQALCRDRSAHAFLQEEAQEGYHDHEGHLRVVESQLLDTLDGELRDALGLVSESQYRELFDRYLALVSSWTKGERMRNRVTGAYERPDEERMVEMERIVMSQGEDRPAFRRSLIAAVGAFRLDHPEAELDSTSIFPDLFRRLREQAHEERKRQLRQHKEDVLRYLGDERSQLDERARTSVETTLEALRTRHGYCERCAQEAVLYLLRRRYTGDGPER